MENLYVQFIVNIYSEGVPKANFSTKEGREVLH